MNEETRAGLERAMAAHAAHASPQRAGSANFNPAPWGYAPGGAVLVMPEVFVGGAERAMLSVVRSTKDGVRWRGFAITEGFRDESMLAEFESIAPVAVGPDACREMIAGSDVVVSWVTRNLPALLPQHGRKPHVVGMSHSTDESPWAVAAMLDDRGIDCYVAVSTPAITAIPEHRRKDATVIPNALDPDRLVRTKGRDEMLREWGLPANAKVLGGLHRLSAEKYPEGMVEAILNLPPEWYGVMVGQGWDGERIRAMVAQRCPGRVILPGARLDIGNVLHAFDVSLVASDYESFCLSLAEACATACPVVGTRVGIAVDHPEIIREVPIRAGGETIAAAVLAAMASPDRLQRSWHARDFALSRWSPEAIGRSWADYLSPWLAAKPAASQTPLVPVGENMARLERVKACEFRGCKVGCAKSRCEKFQRDVTMSECLHCEVTR